MIPEERSSSDYGETDSDNGDDDGVFNEAQERNFINGGKKYPNLEEPIFLNVRRTEFEVMFLIWSFSFHHCLTATATKDHAKLTNCLLDNGIKVCVFMCNMVKCFSFILLYLKAH
jgi:hypothetical protein